MKDVPPWRLHDLRRTAATGMAEIGVAPHIVEAALNHISGQRAQASPAFYNRAAYAPEKKARWSAGPRTSSGWSLAIQGRSAAREEADVKPPKSSDDKAVAERVGENIDDDNDEEAARDFDATEPGSPAALASDRSPRWSARRSRRQAET